MGAIGPISYPPELPITARLDDLRDAIARQPGRRRGRRDRVGQEHAAAEAVPRARPRRRRPDRPHPAAPGRGAHDRRAVAEELGTAVGDVVGFSVRFDDRVGERTRVRVMTDGILLAELQPRPRPAALRHADHRRGPRAQPQRRLPARLPPPAAAAPARPEGDRHVGDDRHGALRRPLRRAGDRGHRAHAIRSRCATDPSARTATRCRRSATPSTSSPCGGDVLVFLSGEREIHDTADFLRRRQLRDTEMLPLYARLSSVEQHRIFQPHRGRRIVLATNVAETSITVPGVRSVVDAGTARISRYSRRLKVQRLPIEPVSRASADQRAGRCGRIAPGTCIRLYSRGRLPRPPGVHRAGDPAHEPGVGHPADDGARARRRGRVPVPRAARRGVDPRRLPAARGARGDPRRSSTLTKVGRRLARCRSTRGSGGWCSRPSATAASARCS